MGDALRIQYTRTRGGDTARFAVVISKKQYARATKRNKIKRTIFEAIRAHYSFFATQTGVKFVVYPLKKDNVPSFGQIERDIVLFGAQF